MSYAERMLPEFDQEMASTRKVLERIPDDKLDWRAHPKSNTIGWNANHLADLPHWVVETLGKPALDISPVDGPRYESPKETSRQKILSVFDRNVAEARQALKAATDEQLNQNWTLLAAGQPIFTMPRSAVLRSFVLNHSIHHRAHLCVYLRLNNIPVPGLYGPSGEE